MFWVKRLISIVLLAALIYFFWPLIGEIRAALGLYRTAHWEWLAIAVGLQVISYGFLTWLNMLALQPFPGRIGFVKLAGLLTSMAFVQAAIPSAGASGIALRVRLLKKFGYEPESSLFSLAVETLTELAALTSFAFLGIVFLVRSGRLDWGDIGLIGIVAFCSFILIAIALRILLNPHKANRLLAVFTKIWNRRLHRWRKLDAGSMEKRLVIFQDHLRCYRTVPWWKFVTATYGKVILDLGTLGACFYLFGYSIRPGPLFTGYGIMLTMSGISALPGGLGLADAYVPVIFSWLGVPGAVAIAAGLTYRLIAFWMLRFIGYISWEILEANPSKDTGRQAGSSSSKE